MAHWEVLVPIVNLGSCGERAAARSMSSCEWVCSEPSDATLWFRGASAPNGEAGMPTWAYSVGASRVLTALFTASGWKTSWSWISRGLLLLGRKAVTDLSSAMAAPRYSRAFIKGIIILIIKEMKSYK